MIPELLITLSQAAKESRGDWPTKTEHRELAEYYLLQAYRDPSKAESAVQMSIAHSLLKD